MGTIGDLPKELVIGWAFWVVGGLALTYWFLRQSASPQSRQAATVAGPSTVGRLSGTHAVARPLSGTHTIARAHSGTHAAVRAQSGVRPAANRTPSGVYGSDAFDELRALLDQPEESPPSR